jgi:hypothetical protein
MIQLKYEVQGKNLIVMPFDNNERNELKIMRDDDPDFASDSVMHDAFETMIANSELQWINPEDTGDLTDAPMLGILGEETIESEPLLPDFPENYGLVSTGNNGTMGMVQPILKRWAFMNYQIKSPLDDLVDIGQAVFVSE